MISPSSWAEDLLARVDRGKDLDVEEAGHVASAMVEGNLPPPLVRDLLLNLARKGESVGELEGFARTMRRHALPFPGPKEAGASDLCGTGGAQTPTFNISTVGAFVASGAGLPIAKHGNVSARGPCGSSDLLRALGLPVLSSVPFARATWEKERLCFLHAPLFHPAAKAVAPIRKELGIRTIFNQVGPLTNPAEVPYQVVGSYAPEYGRKAVEVLFRLGVRKTLAVHGDGGTDELTSQGTTWGWLRSRDDREGGKEVQVDPARLLRQEERTGSLAPRPPEMAAALAEQLLAGKGDGAVRGAVLLTAAAVLWTSGHVPDLNEGVEQARGSLESGKALEKLVRLKEIARSRNWAQAGAP